MIPYFISGHPGCTLSDMADLALFLKRHHLRVEQVQDFTPTPGSLSTWLVNLEGEWLPTETTGLKLGYLHDLGADPGATGGYTTHRVYANARALLAGRYTLQLDGSYEHRDFGAGPLRSADLLYGSPSVGVELARWLSVSGGVGFTKRSSSLGPNAADLPGYDFDKIEAFLRLRGTY